MDNINIVQTTVTYMYVHLHAAYIYEHMLYLHAHVYGTYLTSHVQDVHDCV